MYNLKYGDSRYQSWPPSQEQQAQLQQQQQQPQQQPIPSAQQQPSTQGRQQYSSHDIAPERLWVEVPNDEDTMHQISIFKQSSKSHLTPPLDLSESRRQVESPLDLSVKTRKRCADTTDYGDMARQAHNIDPSVAKRQCLTRDYAYPQGHPNYHPDQLAEKKIAAESLSRSKIMQSKQLTMGNKYPAGMVKHISSTSPSALAQQQYAELQRQQMGHKPRPLPMPHKHPSSPYALSSQVSQQIHPSMQKSPVMYDPEPAVRKKSPLSNMTESVALKGFFEPTHKVTVHTNIPQQTVPSPHQQVYPRVPSDQRIAGAPTLPLPTKSNEMTDYDDLRRQQPFSSSQQMYQQRVPTSTSANYISPKTYANEMQKYHQQIQAQKSQLAMMNQQKNMMMATSEHQQKLAYMHEELQKQAESRGSKIQAMIQAGYPAGGQPSPYSAARQPPSSTIAYQESIGVRKDRNDFSPARCIRVGQPVQLSELKPDHILALEQVQAVRNRPEFYTQGMTDVYKNATSNVDLLHSSQQAMVSNTRMPVAMSRYEEVRPNLSKEIHDRAYYVSRSEQDNEINIHPSVIQRPAGFIPPRIVRGSGLPGDSQRRLSENLNEVHQINRYESNLQAQRYRQEMVAARERERAQYTSKHNDMLSGKEVMKIQQRVAEQRGETNVSGLPNSRNFSRHVVHRENEQLIPRESQMTVMKGNVRRKSITETVSRDSRIAEHNVGSNDLRKGYESVQTIQSSKGVINDTSRENHGELKMISATSCPSERSITKGTSGLKNKQEGMDMFSQFVMRELKRTDDDSSVNPFAHRSLLQEFDRSANSSPVHKPHDAQAIKSDITCSSGIDKTKVTEKTIESPNITTKSDSSYTLPLHIAIPGHKGTTSTSSSSSALSIRSSVIANSKPDVNFSKTPKLMSRKHMILNAFRQEEDLKNTANTVNIDLDEKVPMESAKFAAKKSERETSQHGYPSSPKMPILSPQERNRMTPMVSPAIGEPPALESSSSASNNNNNLNESSKKEINSLEEHLHRLISDAVKGSISKDKDSVYESLERTCRELTSQQPPGKVFLTRQMSQTRNIPVANVAPIVHGKVVSEILGKRKTDEETHKSEDSDEEDAKMADIVTRSLFENHVHIQNKDNTEVDASRITESERSDANEMDEKSNSNTASLSVNEPLFDENSNSNRMSPGLKKLMLYRHRDGAGNSKSLSEKTSDSTKEKQIKVNTENVGEADSKDKPSSTSRNVFGAFREIVSRQPSIDKSREHIADARPVAAGDSVDKKGSGWTGYQHADDADGHEIQMLLNTDYDGDDEQAREKQTAKRNKLSITKQQADRLIKRARHRRNSRQEGDVRGRRILRGDTATQKRFVDFIPQVLPRRTRAKCTASQSQRRHSKSGSPTRKHRHSSGNDSKPQTSPQKTRQRRASSLDRETNAGRFKQKSKHACFSDNELESEKKEENACDSDNIWRNEDESTDEDYFQNYEDEFKQFLRNSDSNFRFKKTSNATSSKKRKGFHFKQKYIFQRKRKPNRGRGRGFDSVQQYGGRLDSIYNFHEESPDPSGIQRPLGDVVLHSNIPVPADLKRVTVGKESGQTMLHRAARMGFEEVVLYCLATGSVDVNARDNAGYTALHECALKGRVQIGKHLLTYGADVNCCSTDGIRPIHDAVENDHLEMLRLLLSYGADPTLSTYAGRSLAKIARTERMLKFIQRYNGDINGYANEKEEKRWMFKRSSNILSGPESVTGCAIFDALPSDPEDESQEACTLSSKPLFTTRRITLEPNKRVEDFLLLDEILDSFRVTRSEFMSQGTSSSIRHLIKQLPVHTLLDAHQDSIYYENFAHKDAGSSAEAIRKVDSTQLIAKMEKLISLCPKRAKV